MHTNDDMPVDPWDHGLHGFDRADCDFPTPVVSIAPETRIRLSQVVAAITQSATPEEIAEWLQDGFPEAVNEQLERPFELDELDAYVDLLLVTLQTPVPLAGH